MKPPAEASAPMAAAQRAKASGSPSTTQGSEASMATPTARPWWIGRSEASAWPIVWATAVPALSMAMPARAAARCSASRAGMSPGARTAVSRWRATRRIASWA